jgi:hypothetical protein
MKTPIKFASAGLVSLLAAFFVSGCAEVSDEVRDATNQTPQPPLIIP